MRCPECGSERTERFRSPVEREDIVIRRHRCRDCTHVFISAQTVVDGELAAQLAPLLEP